MDNFELDFDYEENTISDLYNYVKYCLDTVYEGGGKKDYNSISFYLGAMIDRTRRTGRKLVFLVTDFQIMGSPRVVFFTEKDGDTVKINFDVSFNESSKVDDLVDSFRKSFYKSTDASNAGDFDIMIKLAGDLIKARYALGYNFGYENKDDEFRATLASLMYVSKEKDDVQSD